MSMSTRETATLEALCRCMVPAAYAEEPRVDLAAAVRTRMDSLPDAMQRDLRTALRVFDHPLPSLILDRSVRRFAELTPAARVARLNSWETSAVGFRRTVFQALRRLIVSTYYSIPEQLSAIGYRGPLSQRQPVVEWEGPLPEVRSLANDIDGPVAHAATAAPHLPRDPHSHAHSRQPHLPRLLRASNDDAGVMPSVEVPSAETYRCDVCVVGSGPGGSVVAARLAEAGLSVIVVEEGGYYTTHDFTDTEREMIPRLYADAGARATDDASMSLLQGRSVGGGGTINWMLMLRPREWVMDDWQHTHDAEMLGADELVPALARIEGEVHARFLPDEAHSPSNRIILDGAAALGWAAETARINAQDCVRAGTCGIGCSHGAKRSAGAVFLPRAIAAGARVICDARADRIDTAGDRKRVRCIAVDRVTGRPRVGFTVDAATVVIAAGAVGTPVLLQKSGMGGGAVGRYLRLHPTTAVRGVYGREMYGAAGIPQSTLLTEFMRGDDGYGFWVECPPMLPALAALAVSGFGAEHRRTMMEFPNAAALIVLARDGAKRVRSNGSVLVHRSGRVHIRYRIDSAERKLLAEGMAAAARLHFAVGAREVTTLHNPSLSLRTERDLAAIGSASLAPNRVGLFSAHVNGTCRIGTNPGTSGCDPDAQRHGHPGIYVADGSLFPTAPGVNPQAAIMALGSLIGDRLAARLR